MSGNADRLANAPLGTKAPAIGGGHWVKVANGWKWHNGDTFPSVGADWDGTLVTPTDRVASDRVREARSTLAVAHRNHIGFADAVLAFEAAVRAECAELEPKVARCNGCEDELTFDTTCYCWQCDLKVRDERDALRARLAECGADTARVEEAYFEGYQDAECDPTNTNPDRIRVSWSKSESHRIAEASRD